MQQRKILDHGYIGLVESWGSDERIIEAARMSTDKGFQGWGPIPVGTSENIIVTKPGDEKLLAFLYNNKHMTPFEMAGAIVEVQAPIMVFREWQRHRTQSYNELSARYTELPDLSYIPSIERIMSGAQSKTNKQGSAVGINPTLAELIRGTFAENAQTCREEYEWLLYQGVSRELARLVIPVNQYSRMRASANLRNWMAFLTLRQDESAQFEIRTYANALHDILKEKFPRTLALFDGEAL